MDYINEIIKTICKPGTENYRCYNILKDLLIKNEDFRKKVISGIKENKISGFSEELWNNLNKQNLRFRGIKDFDDIFKNGFNLGYCTPCSKQVSYSLNNCYICGGFFPVLKGTDNCPNGEHTWIEHNGRILDTSLMLDINLEYKDILGYIEENRYNPNIDPTYCDAKDFANDSSLRKR